MNQLSVSTSPRNANKKLRKNGQRSDRYLMYTYLDGEVGVGVEELGAEGQQELLVGVDDVPRLDERLRAHRLGGRTDHVRRQGTERRNATKQKRWVPYRSRVKSAFKQIGAFAGTTMIFVEINMEQPPCLRRVTQQEPIVRARDVMSALFAQRQSGSGGQMCVLGGQRSEVDTRLQEVAL